MSEKNLKSDNDFENSNQNTDNNITDNPVNNFNDESSFNKPEYYDANSIANADDGSEVSKDSFSFVQSDKKLHDQKFTTKPTTFLKDALKRFSKNKSSVTGGIILGLLFILAIFVPIFVPFSTKNDHPYEQNLPMKLFPAGSGFWDGTRTIHNQTLPYEVDDQGNINYDSYVGDPDLENYILKIKNINMGYIDHASSSASGGYAMMEREEAGDLDNQTTFMYCSEMPFDFTSTDPDDDYMLSYTLGTYNRDGYSQMPKFALAIVGHDKASDKTHKKVIPLTEFSSDYGEALPKKKADMRVVQHKTQSVNLSEIVKNATYKENENSTPVSVLSLFVDDSYSFGFIMQSERDLKTAFYVKDFELSKKSATLTEKNNLLFRSFGTENSKVKDANELVQIERDDKSDPSSKYKYWSASGKRFDAMDAYSLKCSILIDAYEQSYGYKSGQIVKGSVVQDWIDKGYVEFDFNIGPKSFKITEKGKKSGEVYIQENGIENLTATTLDSGEKVYTLTCTVLMYKFLGYKSMPVHLFGTDNHGKDLLKYVFSGLRTSLILGLIVATINILIGVIWGSISGYFGGLTDIIMERITDILSGIPLLVLMTVLTLKLGPTFFVFALSLCLTGWIGIASTTRAQFYRYRGREYVLASKTLGAKSPRLIFRHILPNAIGTIITSSILMIPGVIFNEATLSFLGLGLKNLDSLGVILSDNSNANVLSYYSYQLIFPAIIISLLMICFNLFGNGLRDAVNPSLKGDD